MNLTEQTIAGLRQDLDSGKVTSRQLTEAYLDRIDRHDERLGAFLRVDRPAAMRRAERAMSPVLSAFQDQVLVLKHNLNARAIGSLRNELGNIERDTASLIAEMQKAIDEANSFISSMK